MSITDADTPKSTICIHDPWTIVPLEHADFVIEVLQKRIGPRHRLQGRGAFPLALRRDPDAVIFEMDDEPDLYAVVYLSWNTSALEQTRHGNPKTEMLTGHQAVQARINRDHEEWLAQFR